MRLCDTDIERYLDDGIISLTPRPENDKINGATIDVRLGNSFRVFREHSAPYIDLSGPKEEVYNTKPPPSILPTRPAIT